MTKNLVWQVGVLFVCLKIMEYLIQIVESSLVNNRKPPQYLVQIFVPGKLFVHVSFHFRLHFCFPRLFKSSLLGSAKRKIIRINVTLKIWLNFMCYAAALDFLVGICRGSDQIEQNETHSTERWFSCTIFVMTDLLGVKSRLQWQPAGQVQMKYNDNCNECTRMLNIVMIEYFNNVARFAAL